jgi:hypothetical protein
MADEMLRIAGRGEDGLAKAIKTDKEGNVGTLITGNKVGQEASKIREQNMLIRTDLPLQPSPPRVRPTLFFPGYERVLKWMDKNGALYGVDGGTRLQKSTNYGQTWTTIYTIDTATYGQATASSVFVTKSGKIILNTQGGYCFVSDVSQTNFTQKFKFTRHFSNVQFGYGTYENLVWIANYGSPASNGNHANELYISKDEGETFIKVFEGTIVDVSKNWHIHDVQYDPYADRFWMVNGDSNNCQTRYSDDLGITWTNVFGNFADDPLNTQLTSIACYPHGVIFGADHATSDDPDNLRYWPRPKGVVRPPVNKFDIVEIFRVHDDSQFRNFAQRTYQIELDGRIISLMSWYGQNHPPLLLASANGIDWYEIYRAETAGGGDMFHIAGIDPKDSERRMFGTISLADGRKRQFVASLPKFI